MAAGWRSWSRGRKVVVGLLLGFVLIQLIPYGRDHSNPPVMAEPAWDSPATRALAVRRCFDCHSNQTRWPLYAAIAPFSWIIQHHVDEGRGELNFSEWNRPQREAYEAATKARTGEMPVAGYLPLHPEARMSQEEVDRLARGLVDTVAQDPPAAAHAGTGDDDHDDEDHDDDD